MVGSRLTVLGSCGGWPEPGRACSGYVLDHDQTRTVLDLGYGTFPRLLTLLGKAGTESIDAIVITHAHPDHAVDLHALLRLRWFTRRNAPPIPLYAPDDVIQLLAGLEDRHDDSAVAAVFDFHPLPAAPYRIGPLTLESRLLPHYVPNVGVRLTSPGLCVAYTGDTGPDPALADLGRDADLYIVDATDRHQQPGSPSAPAGQFLNLTAAQAGAAAATAGARQLLLSHFWPGNDRAAARTDAARHFPGPVLLAAEGSVINLP